MKHKQSMTLEAGQRALGFFDAHAAAIGNETVGRLRTLIEQRVAELQAFQLEQEISIGSAKGETVVQENARREIYERFLCPIRGIADRMLREKPELPLLKVRSRVPRDGDFITKVITFANAAEKHEAAILNAGMPADFLAQLDAWLGALTRSTETRARLHSRRSAATAGLKAADRGLRDNLSIATSQMKTILKSDSALLADWMASSTIHKPYVEPARYASIKLVGVGAAQAARLHASSTPQSIESGAQLQATLTSPARPALLPSVAG
jgi:hypothetical protein